MAAPSSVPPQQPRMPYLVPDQVAVAIDLPGIAWDEDATLTAPKTGRKLRRWGSVQAACKILAGCDRETMYLLIASGEVRGYKLRPNVNNSHYRVDLLSVWEHKQRQMPR